MSDVIDIALGFDAAYAPHGAAVIASVVRHAPGASFRFILLHDGIDAPLRARVEQAAPGARFQWITIADTLIPPMENREHFSRATLFRLGLEALAPADCRRLIYLDSDIVVMADISDFWRIDMKGQPLAAVVDGFVDAPSFAAQWGLAGAHGYFNGGILLIDMDRIRQDQSFTETIQFVAQHLPKLTYLDQDALNYVFWGRWTAIDPVWNAQRHMAIPSLIEQMPPERRLNGRAPAIIHYTTAEKPWLSQGYHPWAWAYWDNLARTPFLREIADRHGVGPMKRFMLWQRYLRRRI